MQIRHTRSLALFAVVLLTSVSAVQAQTLKGSRASMQRQYQEAVRYGYSFLPNPTSVNSFVSNGYLVKVTGDRMTELHDVSYPYARPEVKMFIQRLSGQYFAYCGEKLTVTSLTRPLNKQPANAADDSVHPTGMAVDLRIPSKRNCRSWLENTLLSLEGTGVLDVTRERNPPHYHVAVYTKTYETYVANLGTDNSEYVVMRGDSLSSIATRTGTSIMALRNHNNLSNDLIRVGQKLQIPREASIEPMPGLAVAVAKTDAAEVIATEAPLADQPDSQNAVATSRGPTQYKVRRGDSLTSIATRTGTSIASLRSANNLRKDLLQIGQVLTIPQDASIEPLFTAAAELTGMAGPTTPAVIHAAISPAVARTVVQVGPPAPGPVLQTASLEITRTTSPLPASSPIQYKVRRGDSLSSIARRMGTSIPDLRRVNGLRNSTIIAGQTLLIPVLADNQSAGSGPSDQVTNVVAVEHKVRRGESLWLIAKRYGTTISRLRRDNNLSHDDLLPGQLLQVSLRLN